MSRLHIFHLCLLSEKGQNWSKNNLEDIIVGKKIVGKKSINYHAIRYFNHKNRTNAIIYFAMENVLIVATANKRLPPQCNAEGG